MTVSRTLIRMMMLYLCGLGPQRTDHRCVVRTTDFDWVPDYDPDILLSGQDIGVGITDLTLDIQVLPDFIPEMLDERAAVRLPLPVVVETGSPDCAVARLVGRETWAI